MGNNLKLMNKIYNAKFTGIIALDEPLEEDKSYSIALEQCEVKRIDTKKLAEDEAERTTFSLENIGRVNILTEKEGKPKILKATAKKCTKSQILRLKIETTGRNYESVMNIILDNWEKLL